ncbi:MULTISPECIES: hypothetical protein [unclassified Polaromonas]|uniref:hypothetical protein n=1 Tax=unclassified Polaromonas TaxID=2638319 RepID=UPI0018CB8E8E|nr:MULTISPECIES: hypothetical protein [unclassified Polaromonas]MBG6074098.1 hypothetical protein [Polaromonas sp. CG_9.7]MBG6116113.1 hypothetical protein [Polaromonas sp. CG_9.2]MDH6182868.1 hypothetical protein [Polaromonas sp. CG_23.6]
MAFPQDQHANLATKIIVENQRLHYAIPKVSAIKKAAWLKTGGLKNQAGDQAVA